MSSPNYSPDTTAANSPEYNIPYTADDVAGYGADFLSQILPADEHLQQPGDSPLTVHDAPSPSDYNFLDTVLNPLEDILNPAGLDHGRYSPFTYLASPRRHLPEFAPRAQEQRRRSPPHTMAPSTRAQTRTSPRPGRLSNGYVDLTAADSPPLPRKRDAPSTGGPSSKRQKRNDGSTSRRAKDEHVEKVDLTADDNVSAVSSVLQKQRSDAVKAQTVPREDKPTTFNTFTCVICMDVPTDLTATACGMFDLFSPASMTHSTDPPSPGHLFCHTCLMEALIAGENRTGPGEPKRSQCPVCRKNISRTKPTDIIPLLLLNKAVAGQPRRKGVKVSG